MSNQWTLSYIRHICLLVIQNTQIRIVDMLKHLHIRDSLKLELCKVHKFCLLSDNIVSCRQDILLWDWVENIFSILADCRLDSGRCHRDRIHFRIASSWLYCTWCSLGIGSDTWGNHLLTSKILSGILCKLSNLNSWCMRRQCKFSIGKLYLKNNLHYNPCNQLKRYLSYIGTAGSWDGLMNRGNICWSESGSNRKSMLSKWKSHCKLNNLTVLTSTKCM